MRTHRPTKALSAFIGTHTLVSPETIVRLEAERNYTRIYRSDGKVLFIARTLKLVEQDLLPYLPLLRVNRGSSINLDFVLSYTPIGEVVLYDQITIEVSRRKLRVVKTILNQHFLFFRKAE